MSAMPRIRFSKLAIAVCVIVLGSDVTAQQTGTIPSIEELAARARAKSRPRSVDVLALQAKGIAEPELGKELVSRVSKLAREALPSEPRLNRTLKAFSPEWAAQMGHVQTMAFGEVGNIQTAALAWLIAKDRVALNEARRRALNVARWSPQGATGFGVHDQAGRSVAWTLALVFDWLNAELGDDERKLLLDAIIPRVTEMLGPVFPYGLDDGRRLDSAPYDSHGAVTLARMTAMCAVLIDQGTVFEKCFRNLMPRYLARQVPWGGGDGGYANGTAYAQWDMLGTHFVVWDILKRVVDVDLWQTSWARGYAQFIAYFLPPGAPSGVFGDDAEKKWREVWATQGKAYAAHYSLPLADWYARNQFGENALQLALVISPRRDWKAIAGSLPEGTASSVHLPSIGWVAMHSNLADRSRTSIYFKSSPYGSFNHSHADQNSFVIHSRGKVVAADSGYYDSYNSAHWKGWYKQTLAHNAITFDSGQGQLHDVMTAKGKITKFERNEIFDLVTGDATQAYGGALSRAVRSMAYVRPDALLVFDSLSSDVLRTWEWNIHTLSEIRVTGDRSIESIQDGVRLCVQLLDAPDTSFSQVDNFAAEPLGNYAKQWHGRFSTREKSKKAVLIALVDVDCHRPEVTIHREGKQRVISLVGKKFIFDEGGGVTAAP